MTSNQLRVDKNVETVARDGVVLRGDLYRPAVGDRFPLLLSRTPYEKGDLAKRYEVEKYVQHGYAVLVQDMRGRFASGGLFDPWVNEGKDGYDTVEWAASQPWCTGKVGMFGASAGGITQWMCALEQPPHLTAIAPSVSGAHLRTGAMMLGTIFTWSVFMALFEIERNRDRFPLDEYERRHAEILGALKNPHPHFRRMPLMSDPLVQGLSPFYYKGLEDVNHDVLWKWPLPNLCDLVNIPVLNIGGWYDYTLQGTLRYHTGMRRHPDKKVREGARLIIGQWYHGQESPTRPPEWLDIPKGSPTRETEIRGWFLSWMDHYLKGDATTDLGPHVRIFTMGEKRWQEFADWPPPKVRYEHWYFHSGGRANTAKGDGTLDRKKPGNEPTDTYVYDPADPVLTVGGGTTLAAYDQRSVESRDDVLVYASSPLQEDVEVTGPIVVKLWAATSARDTDFTARLVDVHPDGLPQNIVDGFLRARYRKSLTKPELLHPDERYEFTIDLYGTSNVFKKGHRIAVEITSSDFPHYDRNTNTGGDMTKESAGVKATQTIFHDKRRPSHIVLPMMKR